MVSEVLSALNASTVGSFNTRFFAALISLSCVEPQLLQAHSLIRRPALPFGLLAGISPPARTSLGCVTFDDFFKNNPCVSAFIFQHCFDHSPACIQNGLSHFGFAKPRELTSPTKIAAFSLTSWRLYLCKSSFYDCGFWRGSLSLVVVCS